MSKEPECQDQDGNAVKLTIKMAQEMADQITNKGKTMAAEIAYVAAKMTENGIPVDAENIAKYSIHLISEMQDAVPEALKAFLKGEKRKGLSKMSALTQSMTVLALCQSTLAKAYIDNLPLAGHMERMQKAALDSSSKSAAEFLAHALESISSVTTFNADGAAGKPN